VASPRYAFEEIEMPLVPVLADMERAGIRVDRAILQRLGDEFTCDLNRLRDEIQAIAGEEFNLNSPKQLGVVLFEKLGISTKGVKKTKSGYSTNAAMLDRLRNEHEIVARILDYREVHKLNSTYIEALMRLVHEDTGRIHASFNQAIAATGRLSSSDPNLQNIPIRNERGRRIRDAFIAEPGCVLIAADYSQIELRVLAHLCRDSGLVEAFRSGEDIHERTAREIFGGMFSSEQERKELRRAAKTINFGLIYGMGAFRLAGDLGVSRKQAQSYIDSYFARYPRVLEYFDELRESVAQCGYVQTLFGHRRYLDTLDTSGRDPGYAVRSMMNAPIQGTAAEIIKRAMIRLHRRLAETNGSARIVLQVHDELVVEVEQARSEEVRELVVTEMEQAARLCVPLSVEVRVGASWGEGTDAV
jgi:DNA polymerase-1